MRVKYPIAISSSLWLLTSAVALPLATNLQGNYSNVLCGNGDIGNSAASAALRWSEADVDDAWTAVERHWNEDSASAGLIFVQAVSHFWNGPEGWNCGIVGQDLCDSAPQSCADKNKTTKDIDTPAGWMILQSFSAIHNFQSNQFETMVSAESAIPGQMGAFASTFAPIADDTETIDIMLDILGIGISLISAGVWSKVISQMEEDPDDLGWAKGSANAVIEGTLNIAKDGYQATTALEAQNNLAPYVSQLIGSWQGIISTYTENLFSGSTKVPDLSDLSNPMKNGAALNNNAALNPGLADSGLFNMQNTIENTLFGLLIPKAWQTSNEDVHPVILALQGYMINGNQNGYQMPNLTNMIDGQGNQGNLYFENGIQTPGLTTIPIYTIDVVSDNWKNYGDKNTKPDGYPCN